MSHFLVTGGCGFIGSHLADALTAAGDTVTVLDDLSSGRRENLPSGVRLMVGDVGCPETVLAAMDGTDGCFHLASVASVAECSRRWEVSHRINQGGSVNVLAAARRLGGTTPLPVVIASSAAVYGNLQDLPLNEQAMARPLSPYGADKLGAELHARVAAETFGGRAIALRIFNAYGPRQIPGSPYSGVISLFIQQALSGQPLTLLGDGGQTRDFIYVADVVRAFRLSMATLLATPAPRMEVYNVCGGQALSVQDLACRIIDTCGSASPLIHAPPRLGDIRASLGDPSAARAGLNFSTQTHLDRGLEATIGWEALRQAGAA